MKSRIAKLTPCLLVILASGSACNPLAGTPSSSVAFLQPPPGSFSIQAATPGDQTVALTWQVAPATWTYNVLRGTASGDYSVTVAGGLAGTSFTDTGLTDYTTYYYMVVAVGPGGTTNASGEIKAIPVHPPLLVIADTGNSRLVTVSNMSGSGWSALTGADGDSFNGPAGVFLQTDASILVADTQNSRIVSMQDAQGDGWTTFGSPGAGTDQFTHPHAVSVDGSGNIYVADSGNGRLAQFSDLNGDGWTTLASANSLSFTDPLGLALSFTGGIFVADSAAGQVDSLTDIQGDGWVEWTGAGTFQKPAGVFVNSDGTVYVADKDTNAIYSLDAQGNIQATLTEGPGSDTFDTPTGICVDASGTIYVADSGNDRIVSMTDMTGTNWTTLTSSGSDSLSNPQGIACQYGLPGQLP